MYPPVCARSLTESVDVILFHVALMITETSLYREIRLHRTFPLLLARFTDKGGKVHRTFKNLTNFTSF